MLPMDTDFAQWLSEEMASREWNQSELSRRSGIGTPQISRVLARERMPGVEFCVAMAKAFKMNPVLVLKRAGLIPPDMETDEVIDRLARVMEDWPAEERLRFLELALVQDEMFRRKPPARSGRYISDGRSEYGPASDREGKTKGGR